MSLPEYHTHETPHQLYGAVAHDGCFYLLAEKDHNQLEQQTYFSTIMAAKSGPQRSAPKLSITQREQQVKAPPRPKRAAPIPGQSPHLTMQSSPTNPPLPSSTTNQANQTNPASSPPIIPRRPPGASSPQLATLNRNDSTGLVQSTSFNRRDSTGLMQSSSSSSSSSVPLPRTDSTGLVQSTSSGCLDGKRRTSGPLPVTKVFPTQEAILAAKAPVNSPPVPIRSRKIYAYPQIDAQLPIQPIAPLLKQTDVDELKELNFHYSERYLYEEGCLARQYWKRKYLQDVPLNRFNRDEIGLKPGNTNLFHMNGDVIQNVLIHEINGQCEGFEVAHTSGHRLSDDDPIGMVLAYDFGAGNYTAFALGQAIRHESYFNPVHFTIHGGGLEGIEEAIHHNYLGGRQNCCHHSVDLVRKEQKDDLKKRLVTFFKKDKNGPLEKSLTVLNQDPMGRTCIQFPAGKIGRFAMLGQNEMQGDAFRTCMLRSNGIYVSPQYLEPLYPQTTSFFSIENKYWRVIVLDTGYWSNFDALNTHEGRLPTDLLRWLDVVVRPADDTRGLIFMSSHPHTTAFTDATKTRFVLKAIEEIIGKERTILWLAGGEHLTAIYEPSQNAQNAEFNHNTYLFCAGAGGLPMTCFADKLTRPPLSPHDKGFAFYDGRVAYQRNYSLRNGKQLTFKHGFPTFARLDFNKDKVTISIKSLQLSYQQHLGLGHEFDVDNPIELASYTFQMNKTNGQVTKLSSRTLEHRDILHSIIPHHKQILDTPIHASTQDKLILDDSALEPLKAGIRNLFLDSMEEWTFPTFPLTVSEQFYRYCVHIGEVLGDPRAREQALEQQKAEQLAALPKSQSTLASMAGSMRGSMRNLLHHHKDDIHGEAECDEEHAVGEPVSMFVSSPVKRNDGSVNPPGSEHKDNPDTKIADPEADKNSKLDRSDRSWDHCDVSGSSTQSSSSPTPPPLKAATSVEATESTQSSESKQTKPPMPVQSTAAQTQSKQTDPPPMPAQGPPMPQNKVSK